MTDRELAPTDLASWKSVRFLQDVNVRRVCYEVYRRHIASGGSMTQAAVNARVSELMRKWKKLPILDSYESIDLDPQVELFKIDSIFIGEIMPQFDMGQTINLPKLETRDDYLTLDTGRDNRVRNRYGRNTNFASSSDMPSEEESILYGWDMQEFIQEADRPYDGVAEYGYYGNTYDGTDILTDTDYRV